MNALDDYTLISYTQHIKGKIMEFAWLNEIGVQEFIPSITSKNIIFMKDLNGDVWMMRRDLNVIFLGTKIQGRGDFALLNCDGEYTDIAHMSGELIQHVRLSDYELGFACLRHKKTKECFGSQLPPDADILENGFIQIGEELFDEYAAVRGDFNMPLRCSKLILYNTRVHHLEHPDLEGVICKLPCVIRDKYYCESGSALNIHKVPKGVCHYVSRSGCVIGDMLWQPGGCKKGKFALLGEHVLQIRNSKLILI